MKLSIESQILDSYNGLQFGIVVAKTVNNERKTFALSQIFDGLSAQTQSKLKKSQLESMPKISNWHNVYNDISGKTFKTSLEKLLRTVLAGREVPFEDNLGQIRDYCMLKWRLPITCFSLNDIYGDVELVNAGKDIVYKDKGGVLTKKWNSEQVERGSLTRQTTSVVYIIENLGAANEEELKEMTDELGNMLKKYCFGAEIETTILNSETLECDLGVEGLASFVEGDIEIPEEPQEVEPQEVVEPVVNDTPIIKEETIPEVEEIKEQIQSAPHTDSAPPIPPPIIEHPEEENDQSIVDATSLKSKIQIMLEEAVKNTFPEAADIEFKVEYPRDHTHGDYACSVAMKLAKKLGQNPLEIASKIKSNIKLLQFVDSVEVAQPGFINIKLSGEFLAMRINEINEDKPLFDASIGHGMTVVIDYSSPNIAKPLGVHHLLSTIIGQSIYNIYNAIGFNTISVNHLGDWGTQFGKLIYAFKTWGNKREVERDPIPELLKLYVKFHDEAEQDDTIEDKGREEFRKLEEGDEENYKLWEWLKDLSMKHLKETYKKLGVHFDEYIGESFYNDKTQEVLDEGQEKGVIETGDGGALIVNFEDENTSPFMVRKSDGSTLYSTRDLATVKYRIQKWNPVQMLYVVDSAQSLHFKQLFETAAKMDYNGTKFKHISFGRMSMPDKTMSTRKGNIVLLEEILKDGVQRAAEIVSEKSKDLKKKEKIKVAELIATGAIKYNILSQNRTTNIVFEWDKMLAIEGNSAPYLQYTYARAESILRKAIEENKNQTDLFQTIEHVEGAAISAEKGFLEDRHELDVARLLPKFQEYLVMAAQDYKPNLFANYLYELAQAFNGFYNSVSVIKTEDSELKAARLNLTRALSRALKEGLGILGIEVPERM